ncbi:hypothetical protein JTG28_004167 [Escherichia coli]|nr:hypothetical protein [Escherichia coli]HAJ7191211.1 hypothetical protein [Escherichia coli]
MVVIRLWRGNSKLDGEYSRVIEDVNRGRFYELAYSERRENVYLDESIPTWRKVAGLNALIKHGFWTDHNTLEDAELVKTFYVEGE